MGPQALVLVLLFITCISFVDSALKTYVLGYPGPDMTKEDTSNGWEGSNMYSFRTAVSFYFSYLSPLGVEVIPYRMDGKFMNETIDFNTYLDGIFWGEVYGVEDNFFWVDRVVDFFLSGGDVYLAQDSAYYSFVGQKLGIPGKDSEHINCTNTRPPEKGCPAGIIENPTSPLFQGPFGTVTESLCAEGDVTYLAPPNNQSNGTLDAMLFRNGSIAGPFIFRWEKGQYSSGAGRLLIMGDGDVINTDCTGSLAFDALSDNGKFTLNLMSWFVGANSPAFSSSFSDSSSSTTLIPPKVIIEQPKSNLRFSIDSQGGEVGGAQIYPSSSTTTTTTTTTTSFQLVVSQLTEVDDFDRVYAAANVPLFSSDRFRASTENTSSILLDTDLVVKGSSNSSNTFAHMITKFRTFDQNDSINFAGVDLNVNPSTMKFTVEIYDWPFQSMSHKLVMTFTVQGSPAFLSNSLSLQKNTPVPGSSTYSFGSASAQGSLVLIDYITKDSSLTPVPILHSGTLDSRQSVKIKAYFPAFESSLIFDPNLQMLVEGNKDDSESASGDVDKALYIFIALFIVSAAVALVLAVVLAVAIYIIFHRVHHSTTIDSVAL
eukprot:TRINITY_DN2304_c0_g2_i1.p1 TRINITY_DN2304_c0_g2~~TRINITY_DN2304_c0_g2_i1.p1  ORF type:complete len:599 (+),score=99.46 TRINITY_DN2304_c0_g2_i1:51-1847(+)